MARIQGEPGAALSLLDRLIDAEPKVRSEAPLSRTQSIRMIKASVRRDLEWLLNTRRVAVDPPPGLTDLERSVYMYGLPDLSSFSLSAPKDRERLLRMLQSVVKNFEPRLANVRVMPAEAPDNVRHVLAFRIEALLLMDPEPEQVSFDTVLELSSGNYQVKGEA